MANIIYRASVTPTVPTSTTAKGAPLTNLEVDGNFKSINTDVASRALAGANTDLTSIGGLTTALSLAQGGTGATSVATGPFAAKGINTDITSLGGITTPLSVSQGGSGTTTLTGLVKGVGTGPHVAAIVRTDYAEPTGGLVTGILKSTTSTGAHTIAVMRTDYAEPTGGLVTGILKSTTSTGAHTIAVAADFPTLNQNTTGSASSVTGIVAIANGGTGATTASAARTALGIGGLINSVISVSTTAVASTYYIVTASITLTLPVAPNQGDVVGFSNASGTLNCIIGRNSLNINSIAQDMTVNKLYAAFTLQYTDATRGWVFV